jgi:hypothetical protein
MKGNTNTRKLSGWTLMSIFLIAALLAGCSGPTPTLEPTRDQQPTFDAIQTQAVATVVANMTMNAPTATEVPTETPVIPTDTPVPTNTPEPIIELPTATATRIPATLAPLNTSTPTQAALQCSIVEAAPASGAKIDKDTDFDARWKLKNTGTKAWQTESVDLKYVSGTKFQKYADVYDLTEGANPDGQITLVVDMVAPNTSGRHTATWALVDGGVTICTMVVTINVP